MITTDRKEFIGANVTPEIKAAVRQAAADQKKSMSAWVHDTLVEKLTPPSQTEVATEVETSER